MSRANLLHYGAFESTKIHGCGTDVLQTTRHTEKWNSDLEMLRNAGIFDLRYSAPWHSIESRPGHYDWSWMDRPMNAMRRSGMRPVMDPLHHTSFPDWLEGGFANPHFPYLYLSFLSAFLDRYPWVTRYTPFNEPLPTTLFCSYTGLWHPHFTSDRDFVRMVMQVAQTISQSVALIRSRQPQAEIIHVDTCERHYALDSRSERLVEFMNERRYLFHDLLLGRMNRNHPLYGYLKKHGATPGELAWFEDHPIQFDVIGLDYYPHSEMDWTWHAPSKEHRLHTPSLRPRGFASVATDYACRFETPLQLTETNIAGTVGDRITWLKFMERECEVFHQEFGLKGFCWYPSIDTTDWNNCCVRHEGKVDPQGIWLLDESRQTRHASELSDHYTRLAKGESTHQDLPAYRFSPYWRARLKGFRALMSGWKWREFDEAVDTRRSA